MEFFQIGGLFLTITATLGFTTWAEGWLSRAPSIGRRTTAQVSSVADADPARKRVTARAA